MNSQRVCPFYGQGLNPCDVGAGYISPYQVEIIVRHCSSRYEGCARYQELSGHRFRSNVVASTLPAANGQRTPVPGDGSPFPSQFEREAIAILHREICGPLSSIRSLAELLLGGLADDPDIRRRFLQIIQEKTVRLTRTMDGLFEREESKALAPTPVKPGRDARGAPNPTTQVETSI
ncbi:MAG: hypothetical protein P9E24_09040 [Candidatus Competibacter sp.]|nr:hypothetical protein [Candidatus Competibacter sp.]MDG4582932.1 hypothetical protein [Candidatus Competibacter sp.]